MPGKTSLIAIDQVKFFIPDNGNNYTCNHYQSLLLLLEHLQFFATLAIPITDPKHRLKFTRRKSPKQIYYYLLSELSLTQQQNIIIYLIYSAVSNDFSSWREARFYFFRADKLFISFSAKSYKLGIKIMWQYFISFQPSNLRSL